MAGVYCKTFPDLLFWQNYLMNSAFLSLFCSLPIGKEGECPRCPPVPTLLIATSEHCKSVRIVKLSNSFDLGKPHETNGVGQVPSSMIPLSLRRWISKVSLSFIRKRTLRTDEFRSNAVIYVQLRFISFQFSYNVENMIANIQGFA